MEFQLRGVQTSDPRFYQCVFFLQPVNVLPMVAKFIPDIVLACKQISHG